MGESKRTSYVVLKWVVPAPGIGGGWVVVGTFPSGGASQALRHAAEKLVAEGESGDGTYAAVPARSWSPTKLAVETTTKLRWHGTEVEQEAAPASGAYSDES